MTRATIATLTSITLLGGLGWMLLTRANPAKPNPISQTIERFYSASGQVLGVKALGAKGCEVKVKLHQWNSISTGFNLAEIPQKGQIFQIAADANQCVALEVALASQGDPDDLKSPRHINYIARQNAKTGWYLAENPTAPVGCGGL